MCIFMYINVYLWYMYCIQMTSSIELYILDPQPVFHIVQLPQEGGYVHKYVYIYKCMHVYVYYIFKYVIILLI